MPSGPVRRIAVLGTGPAGLMAADVLTRAGHSVTLYEKRRSPGRKLLIAGSSGLNVGNDLAPSEFARQYRGSRDTAHWERLLSEFSMRDWLGFLERELGLETFLGTSGRYFVREMKAAGLLRTWMNRLRSQGAVLQTARECVGFSRLSEGTIQLEFGESADPSDGLPSPFDAVCFALGGGSWEPDEKPLRWPAIFERHGLRFTPFSPSNSGFQVAWKPEFLTEAEGQPLKSITFSTALGSRRGELMVTRYGLEGTPVYSLGSVGTAWIDLKPDLTREQVLERLTSVRENLSPLRRARKKLQLGSAALALLFHHAPREAHDDLEHFASLVKRFPVELLARQPLDEAISSAGGLAWEELDDQFMLRAFPGVFAAGEMIDWDAPTGGFLIQGAVCQGALAGRGILKWLQTAAR